jgi:hypothetical protein
MKKIKPRGSAHILDSIDRPRRKAAERKEFWRQQQVIRTADEAKPYNGRVIGFEFNYRPN